MFIAFASDNSVSAGSPEDYKKKASLVIEDFVMPIVKDKLKSNTDRTKS